jgi:hypothetical protein
LPNNENVDAQGTLQDPLNSCQKSRIGHKSLPRWLGDGGRL